MKITVSDLFLVVIFLVFLCCLFLADSYLLVAHIDGSAVYFSSDGPEYYNDYVNTYHSVDLFRTWQVFLRASPILLLILTDGDLFPIQIFNLAVMFVAMRVAFSCLKTFEGRMIFLVSSLLFPYYMLGFLSLNKEVYAMCAAIFYAGYIVRGRLLHLLFSFALALMARYYMVASLLMVFATMPRRGKPRWSIILGALLAISVLAPTVKSLVPQYSSEGLLDNSGETAVLLNNIVSNYGYFLLYPFKYILILVTRPYAFLSANTDDLIGAIVSVWSLVALSIALWLWFSGKRLEPMVKRLIVVGLVAPIPMMWSEIMHWRYHSYVFFFFLFAILLHLESGQRVRQPAITSRKAGQPAAEPMPVPNGLHH